MCDFNLSRVMEESAVLSSMAATNPRWLAPEILGGRGYTFSSDIYSFGIILWEFLTWRVPWWDCGPWQVRAAPPPACCSCSPLLLRFSGSSFIALATQPCSWRMPW